LLSFNESVRELLECTIDSVKQVMQIPVTIDVPYLYKETALQTGMCVLVGFTGEIAGRMLIDGGNESFGRLGENMYGMALEGEMLHSFVGEIANMVAGNICTLISEKGRKVDITPPTITVEEMKLLGFEKVIFVPLAIENVGEMNIILLLQQEKVA
jgi:chemotaxis protein CheX